MIGLKGRSFAIAVLGGLLAATQATAQLVPTPGPDGIVHLSRHANPPECLTPTAAAPAPAPTASSEPTPAPTPIATPVPNRIAVAVPTYSAWSASVGPGVNAVENGTMSGGIGARGALVAVSARAGGDGNSYCRRDGRSNAMIDACLKNFANR
ncbi:hypothetical protein [Methylobacterium radiotolerans]|uniref:hypothetical protein n=1 Tax=Methylobacterium radiotolerans TaxID=31998 RepID=UPI0038D0ED02